MRKTPTHESPKSRPGSQWIEWLPLAVFPLCALIVSNRLPPWVFMWILAFAIYAGLKWASWWKRAPSSSADRWRSAAYLLAWPGMDAKAFLKSASHITRTGWWSWFAAIFASVAGGILLWGVARHLPFSHPLLRGWSGMLGIVL